MHHEMGLLDVHDFRVFSQYFGLRNNRHGTVFLLHGYLDHSGLQGPTISRLLDLGFDVVALDHPGHGFSTGDRASIGDFQHYVDSLSVVYEHYEKTPGPHIVMGHSLGGAISMTHMLKHPHAFQKAVLVAPLFRPRGWRWIRSLHLAGKSFIRGQRRVFRQNTRDETFRRFIREEDPLSPVFIPIEWITSMFRWIREFHGLEKVDARVLVVQGTDDATVDWRGNMPMIRSKFADVRVHLVSEGLHHLLNEVDAWRDIVWQPIEPFLLEHIK
jgi:alpha-beta hydrolase superfamily lysophospholipase